MTVEELDEFLTDDEFPIKGSALLMVMTAGGVMYTVDAVRYEVDEDTGARTVWLMTEEF